MPRLELEQLRKSPDSIIVFGLPRSGNMWLSNLLSTCLALPFQERVEICHDAFDEIPFRYCWDIARAVYMMRDLRDLIVSFYHYSKTESWEDGICVFDDIESFYFEYFTKLVMHYGPWCKWEDHPNDFVGWGVPVVKYERLYDNPAAELARLFQRWNIPVAKDAIQRSVERNSFENFKSGNVSVEGVRKSHFRRGGYGHYREELPGSVVSDINTRFGDYLMRWGYQI